MDTRTENRTLAVRYFRSHKHYYSLQRADVRQRWYKFIHRKLGIQFSESPVEGGWLIETLDQYGYRMIVVILADKAYKRN